MLVSVNAANTGLSPLARGTLHGFGFLFDGRRFIPAGAGNTYIRAKNKATATVYPRWRGEHIYQNISFYSHGGLSPLARGTRIKHGLTRRAARFIPAGAGNTPRLFKRGRRGSVYPRWRGEHHKETILRFVQVGLSPLARGTLLQCQQSFPDCRFIPAGAGNTKFVAKLAVKIAVYPRWRGEHSKHNLLLINDFLSQSQSTNFIVSHKQHIHYVKEHLIH